ncbi:anti-phage dCTP deaminase [Bradyrhizobium sp. LjRoot220]|uniref:anti-phage dCTP deaminase n=1 Tax=Bradyrhizobium sp. LjRoot220 TaxID=3342284 RepID=UPI003ECC902A
MMSNEATVAAKLGSTVPTLSLPIEEHPELIFGLVGPIGVDLESVTECLSNALADVGYDSKTIRITELMKEVGLGLPLDAAGYIDSYRQRIDYANKVREVLKRNDALAILAISAIREFRFEATGNIDEPKPKQAYIIRQFKRPEEVKLLRSVYGRQFIQISAYAPTSYRKRRIATKERQSKRNLISLVDAENAANSLVKQDEMEQDHGFGQNVRDAFPFGDLFIEAPDKKSCKETVTRFVTALFGDNEASPTHDEYGMYLAKSTSLRSSALTRQVGAAIFRHSGEVISLGCNEVPKAGGGTYWSGDPSDMRDFVGGRDPNDEKKTEVLVDLVDRLMKRKQLSPQLVGNEDAASVAAKLLLDDSKDGVRDSKVMDLIEFGRDIHAEMSAITDAARKGVPIEGATLYSTTFPCHLCAKHIVAAGIKRVVYIEPYPKSYAEDLHSDSIELDAPSDSKRVNFQRFIGISPYRYRDLFEKGKRKYQTGEARKWSRGEGQPMLEIIYPTYFKAETFVVDLLSGALNGPTTATGR